MSSEEAVNLEHHEKRKNIRRKVYISEDIRCRLKVGDILSQGWLYETDGQVFSVALKENYKNVASLILKFSLRDTNNYWNPFIQVDYVNDRTKQIGDQLFRIVTVKFVKYEIDYNYLLSFKNDFFCMIGKFHSPIFFGEVIYVKFVGVLPDALIGLVSNSNKGIFPQTEVRLTINIALLGTHQVKSRILSIEPFEDGEKYFLVVFSIDGAGPYLLSDISEFLISFHEVSLNQIKKYGQFIKSINTGVRITYIHSDEEWEEVLSLRLRSYKYAGKFEDKSSSMQMSDPFDKYARHVVAKLSGRIVGSGRIVFCGSDVRKSEHHHLGLDIPEFIIKEGFCESSRTCVDPDFQGQDIFILLIRQLANISFQDGIRYMLVNCNPSQWIYYRKLGFNRVGEKFSAYGRNDCQLAYCDCHHNIFAKGTNFIAWNQVNFPIAEQILSQRNRTKSIKLFLHKIFYPLFSKMKHFKRYNAYKKGKRSDKEG